MMTCQEIAEFLADYLDGTLPFRQQMAFQFHLFLCRDCRRYLASYNKTLQLIQTLKSDGTSAGIAPVPEALARAILAARNCDHGETQSSS